jgi:hypothetical protein
MSTDLISRDRAVLEACAKELKTITFGEIERRVGEPSTRKQDTRHFSVLPGTHGLIRRRCRRQISDAVDGIGQRCGRRPQNPDKFPDQASQYIGRLLLNRHPLRRGDQCRVEWIGYR